MVIWGVGILRSGLAFLHVLLNTHYVCMYGGCSINELCFYFTNVWVIRTVLYQLMRQNKSHENLKAYVTS